MNRPVTNPFSATQHPTPSRHQVVVTGMGTITPSGHTVESLWEAVLTGTSAIDVLAGEQFKDLAVRIGARVKNFDATGLVPKTLLKRLSPVQLWALAAADQALAHAGIDTVNVRDAATVNLATSTDTQTEFLPWPAGEFSVTAATGSGPVDAMQAATRALDSGGPRAVPLTLAIYGAPDAVAALASQRYGARGPARGISATCASGAVGIGEAMRAIRHSYATAVLVIGMEDCLGPVNLASNANMRALAAGYEDNPTAACRPFDKSRSGFVMGQGAAAVLLERADAAQARGATPLARIAGFGASSDAHHPTAPHPSGRGAAAAMAAALTDAGVRPQQVVHVNAHGTGTSAGDAAEIAALRTVFGEHLARVPITATKPVTGHLLGASGVVEAIIAVQTLRTGLIPPTLNLGDTDFVDCDIVTSPRELAASRETASRGETSTETPGLPARSGAGELASPAVVSNSFGFGGHNASLLLTGPETAERTHS